MPDFDHADNLSILSQLDESEKGDIITSEELEEIGAAYGSRKKYEETMRGLAGRLSGTQMGQRLDTASVGMGRNSPRIRAGTSTVAVGNLPKIKKINIVGKVISSAEDAVLLFSSFRDPRIEIFNIVYTSDTGNVLAHTAWTVGLPSVTTSIDNPDFPLNSIDRINSLKDKLGAKSIWIAHNHPSGDAKPSPEDIRVTRNYSSFLRDSFKGHLVLDHDNGSFISPDGTYYRFDLQNPLKIFAGKRIQNAREIDTCSIAAAFFKKILTNDEDIIAYSFLDRKHRIVSWVYGDGNNLPDIKNYMRASGAASVIALTNHKGLYDILSSSAINSINTRNDIFLDVIHVDKKTGSVERDFVLEMIEKGIEKNSAEWQKYEPKTIKYIVNNQVHLNPSLVGSGKNNKEQNMSDLNEPEAVSKREFTEAEEAAFRNAIDQRKVISAAIKNGTLSCLPGADGYADTGPAVNLENGTRYHGANLLFLKEHQKMIGAPSAEYVTAEQLEKAKLDVPGIALKDRQQGVSIHFSEKTEGNEYVNKIIKLINIAQTNKPGELKVWAEGKQQERAKEQEDYLRNRYGDFYRPREQKKEGPGPEISCSSTEPEKYLAQYLAAVSTGGKFKASPEQARDFSEKMQASLSEKMPNGYPDPFKLSKITNEASRQCKDIIRGIKNPKPEQEQKLEQQQSRGGRKF